MTCALTYPLQLYCRLDSWSSLSRLPRGSVWYERPCISDLAYTDDAVLLGNSYREVQEAVLEAGNRHAATVGMHINVSKAKAMSALTPGEQR